MRSTSPHPISLLLLSPPLVLPVLLSHFVCSSLDSISDAHLPALLACIDNPTCILTTERRSAQHSHRVSVSELALRYLASSLETVAFLSLATIRRPLYTQLPHTEIQRNKQECESDNNNNKNGNFGSDLLAWEWALTTEEQRTTEQHCDPEPRMSAKCASHVPRLHVSPLRRFTNDFSVFPEPCRSPSPRPAA